MAAAGLVVQSDPARKPQAAQIHSYSKTDGLVGTGDGSWAMSAEDIRILPSPWDGPEFKMVV
ncbi:hypothetical protein N9X46_07150 [Paracoccaceae bacterium]|nr:hypothetical protein [Paracoccaceae bacterium]MDC3290717.1 hypothetical protein [bacterium]